MHEDLKSKVKHLALLLNLPEFADYELYCDPMLSFPENLCAIMEVRKTNSEESAYRWRVGRANFEKIKTMDTFEYSPERFPQLCWPEVQSMLDGGFIDRHEDCIFYSENNGHGKSHLATAIGLEMIRMKYSVLFKNFAKMVDELRKAQSSKKLDKYLRSVTKPDLLIIDEFGLNEIVRLSRKDARLVVRVIRARHERSSTFFTTNLKPTEWSAVLNDEEKLTNTVISRISHHSHILKMDGPFDWRVEHALSNTLAEQFGKKSVPPETPEDSGAPVEQSEEEPVLPGKEDEE